MSFNDKLASTAALVEVRLASLLDRTARSDTSDRLLAAMRHGVLNGGKRLRPFLLIESAALFSITAQAAITAAAALEFVHCYSLVHDDLPSMDNDDVRRSQPTVHKAFDEWTAILAGDALQTLAFELLASPEAHPDPTVRSELVLTLARAAGADGMAGGQALDLEAERIHSDRPADVAHITCLQSMKTGRLITFAAEAGAILGGAKPEERAALKHYGECLGFQFQIRDDLLDAEGDTAVVGKATGKDATSGKATLVSLVGAERAREHMNAAEASAIAALAIFGPRAQTLADAARFVSHRKA